MLAKRGLEGRTAAIQESGACHRHEASAASWKEILDVNLMGYVFCAKAAVPLMRRNKGGAIVNVASVRTVVAGARRALSNRERPQAAWRKKPDTGLGRRCETGATA